MAAAVVVLGDFLGGKRKIMISSNKASSGAPGSLAMVESSRRITAKVETSCWIAREAFGANPADAPRRNQKSLVLPDVNGESASSQQARQRYHVSNDGSGGI